MHIKNARERQQHDLGFSLKRASAKRLPGRLSRSILETDDLKQQRDESFSWTAGFYLNLPNEINLHTAKTYGKTHLYDSCEDLRRYAIENLKAAQRINDTDFISSLEILRDVYCVDVFLKHHNIDLKKKITRIGSIAKLSGAEEHIKEVARCIGVNFIDSAYKKGLNRIPLEATNVICDIGDFINNRSYACEIMTSHGMDVLKLEHRIDQLRRYVKGFRNEPAFTQEDHPAFHPLLFWGQDFGFGGLYSLSLNGLFAKNKYSSVPEEIERQIYNRCKGHPFDLTVENGHAAMLYQLDFLESRPNFTSEQQMQFIRNACKANDNGIVVQYKINIEHFVDKQHLCKANLPLHNSDLMYLMTQKNHQELFNKCKSITDKVKCALEKKWWSKAEKDAEVTRMLNCVLRLEQEFAASSDISDELKYCLGL
jgi:hypothetical protein